MRLRKNILNKKSQGLVFGFFLFCIGFYLVTYSYISNKRQEIFDEMNMKVYEKQTEVVKTEEIEVPEIDSVDSSLEEETTVDIADDGVVAPTYKDSANYIGTISIPKIQLKAGFVSMNSKNVIKNLYTVKKEYLSEIFRYIRMERSIAPSTVTNIYTDLYKLRFKS